MQDRFSTLLTKSENIFRDKVDTDIDTHHLLSYVAKYWDKHLDLARDWQIFCEPVRNFVLSQKFFTCLQVQSLLVGGKLTRKS